MRASPTSLRPAVVNPSSLAHSIPVASDNSDRFGQIVVAPAYLPNAFSLWSTRTGRPRRRAASITPRQSAWAALSANI
jgi:hypothetical protein